MLASSVTAFPFLTYLSVPALMGGGGWMMTDLLKGAELHPSLLVTTRDAE
jgi:hypothetical protein